MLSGRYSKLAVAVAGAATTAIETYAAHTSWAPIVIGAIAAALVWLVPNTPPGPPK